MRNDFWAVDEVALALNADQRIPDPDGVFRIREMMIVVIRNALLLDARHPPRPSECGLPEMIQAAIAVGVKVLRLVDERGTSKSIPRNLEQVANAPLVLLAGALLRSQNVHVAAEEMAPSRLICQVLNALLWGA